MAMQAGLGRNQPLAIDIEAGTAYELLMTLCVIFDVEGYKTYDVGSEWFAAVRAKASPGLLASLSQSDLYNQQVWEHLLGIVYECPPPRNIPTLLAHIEAMDPLELRLHLLGYYVRLHRRSTPPDVIYQAALGQPDAQKRFLKTSFPDDADWQQAVRSIFSLGLQEMKSNLLNLLQRWYEEVFREQEAQILPVLERDVEAKRALKSEVSAERLIELATGWEYVPEPGIRRVVLIPSYVLRPWVSYLEHHDVKIFCYPVADESITADSNEPSARLVRLTKALGDERRLRILKKLATGSYTLQEMADDFGVAKSTMHHHLVTLRSAGLVRVRMSDKRYSLREEAIHIIGDLLSAYLEGGPV